MRKIFIGLGPKIYGTNSAKPHLLATQSRSCSTIPGPLQYVAAPLQYVAAPLQYLAAPVSRLARHSGSQMMTRSTRARVRCNLPILIISSRVPIPISKLFSGSTLSTTTEKNRVLFRSRKKKKKKIRLDRPDTEPRLKLDISTNDRIIRCPVAITNGARSTNLSQLSLVAYKSL